MRVQTQEVLQHRTGLADSLASQGEGLNDNAVEIFGLQKVFRGTSRMRSATIIFSVTCFQFKFTALNVWNLTGRSRG